MENDEFDMNKKNKISIEIILTIITSITAILVFFFGDNIVERFTEQEGEKSIDELLIEAEQEGGKSIDELLMEAEQEFKIQNFIEAYMIYKDDILKYNTVALNNIGYLFSKGLGVEKNITEGRDYYYRAAVLGNKVALDNYICSILYYPSTYNEIIEALKWGHEGDSLIAEEFVENMQISPEIVELYGNNLVESFWEIPHIKQRGWLKTITVKGEVLPTNEILSNEKSDFIGELCQRKEKQIIGYRRITYSNGQIMRERVYGLVTVAGYQTYYLQDTKYLEKEQIFIVQDESSGQKPL